MFKSDTNLHNRRDFLILSGLAAAGAAIGTAVGQSTPPQQADRKRSIRIAHLTDIHVQPERRAGEGLAACFRHVQSLSVRPELILNGGDAIMDAFDEDIARTRLQWDLLKAVMKAECSIPMEFCIGNHDIWGWNRKKSKATGTELNYGKKYAMDEMGLARPYRSFNRAGWHFIALDGVQPKDDDGYTAYLDDEQYDWLESDLKGTPPGTPTLVFSHIPILSAAPILTASTNDPEHRVSRSLVHGDAAKIKNLFLRFPNVKLCLSGHLHLVDRVDYAGVSYLCDGAVSGAWWKGAHHECTNGYAVIDLYSDGTFEREYVEFGWKASA